MVLLDVTGHGVPSAITVARLAGELERIFAEMPNLDAAGVLRLLNRYIRLTIARYHVFATAFVASISPGSSTLSYAGAGHPAGLLYRHGSGELEQLESCVGMLGVFEDDEFECVTQVVEIERGDVLLTYTDGVCEARNESGKPLGDEVFARWAEKVMSESRGRGLPLPRRLRDLFSMVKDYRGGEPEDDSLLVGLMLSR